MALIQMTPLEISESLRKRTVSELVEFSNKLCRIETDRARELLVYIRVELFIRNVQRELSCQEDEDYAEQEAAKI